VIVAAGDIATSGSGDTQTAAVIAGLPPETHVLALGDLAYEDGTLAQLNNYYEPTWGQFKARTSPAVGNHDSHVFGAPGYFDYFEGHNVEVGNRGEGWYAHDIGDWRVIILNSECNGTTYDFCDHNAQLLWLQAELAANPRQCTVAAWHRSMKAASGDHTDDEGNFLEVWQMLYDAGVSLVLTSHEHNYQRYAPYNRASNAVDPNGIREIVTGTGGNGSIYPITHKTKPGLEAYQSTAFGVLKVTLNSDSYAWEFLPVAGETYTDTGTGSCRGNPPTVTPSPTAAPSQMSIDAYPAGNSATTVGPRDPCIQLSPGGTTFVDVTAQGITPFDDGGTPSDTSDDTGGIIGYSYSLQYAAGGLSVQSRFNSYLLKANAGSTIFAGGSDPLPDSDGSFTSAVMDIGNGVPESGNGVLERLTIRAAQSAAGLYPLSLAENGHVDASGANVPPVVTNNAVIAVGVPCPGGSPTPTPTPPPDPGIVLVSMATSVNTTDSASVVIARPSGTVAGDVLVASLALNGSGVAGVPSGWVPMAAVTAATNPKLYAYYRVAGGSEPASYTWSLTSAAQSSGGIARYTGVDPANPLDSVVSTASNSASISVLSVPGVTTGSAEAMLIGAAAINASPTTVTITGPSGMNERWDLGGKRQEYDDAVQATEGPSGAKAWSFSSPRAAAGWLAALRPAP
jgi:hypothetical protein